MAELAQVTAGRLFRGGWMPTPTTVRLLTIAVVLGAYEIFSRAGVVYDGIVPSLIDISSALLSLLRDTELYFHLSVTALEVFAGLLIGGAIGLLVGFYLALLRKAGDILQPILLWIAPTPKIVFLPILMLIFGLGIETKIAKASLSAFFPVFVASFAAARQVKQVYLSVMDNFNAGLNAKITYVYLPAITLSVLSSIRLAFGVAMVGTLLAEIKMSNMGIGYLVIQAYNFFNIPEMYALLIITFSMALLVNTVIDRLSKSVRQ
jgi:NitT/TauT family transport system permease protein